MVRVTAARQDSKRGAMPRPNIAEARSRALTMVRARWYDLCNAATITTTVQRTGGLA